VIISTTIARHLELVRTNKHTNITNISFVNLLWSAVIEYYVPLQNRIASMEDVPKISINETCIHVEVDIGYEIKHTIGHTMEVKTLTTEANKMRITFHRRWMSWLQIHIDVTNRVGDVVVDGVDIRILLDCPAAPPRQSEVYVL